MTKFFSNILQTVIAAALVSLVVLLWNFNDRLSRLETRFEIILSVNKNIAIK